MKNIKVYLNNKREDSIKLEKPPYKEDLLTYDNTKYKVSRVSITVRKEETYYKIYAYK